MPAALAHKELSQSSCKPSLAIRHTLAARSKLGRSLETCAGLQTAFGTVSPNRIELAGSSL